MITLIGWGLYEWALIFYTLDPCELHSCGNKGMDLAHRESLGPWNRGGFHSLVLENRAVRELYSKFILLFIDNSFCQDLLPYANFSNALPMRIQCNA